MAKKMLFKVQVQSPWANIYEGCEFSLVMPIKFCLESVLTKGDIDKTYARAKYSNGLSYT